MESETSGTRALTAEEIAMVAGGRMSPLGAVGAGAAAGMVIGGVGGLFATPAGGAVGALGGAAIGAVSGAVTWYRS